MVTVTYLNDMENVEHCLALSSYHLISSNNTEESVKGKLHIIACQLERKEKGAKYVRIDAVTDPGTTTSMLSRILMMCRIFSLY